MTLKILHSLLAVLACIAGLCTPIQGWAANACSPSIGKATLNEYNYLDNFTEVRKLDAALNMTGWKVTVYTSNRTSSATLPSGGVNACFGGLFHVSQFASNEVSSNADIVLTDANGDVVDIVRVRTSLPVATSFYPSTVPSCGFASPPYDLLVESSNKGVDRLPDGVGEWRNTPGTGSNSFQSRCGSNISGGNADLMIGKSASATSVAAGSAVTFTINVRNVGPTAATNVQVDDLLPGGLTYLSHSSTVGTYAPATGIWTVGTLAAGGSIALTINAAVGIGTFTNTAKVGSESFDPITENNVASVSVTGTPTALNAVEQFAAVSNAALLTKLAGTQFSLDVVALTTSGTINGNYSRTVTAVLVDASSSSVCTAMSALAGTSSTLAFSSANNGRRTYSFVYANAMRNVRVRMTDNSNPAQIVCSTDAFAIRPQALAIASSNANADAAGTLTATLTAIKAGGNFALTATAIVGYNQAPLLDSAKIAAHGGAVTTGIVSGGFGVAPIASGVASGTTFSYSEVGYFRFAPYGVYDESFTAVDQPGSCRASNTCDCLADGADSNSDGVPDNFSQDRIPAVVGRYGCDFGNTGNTNYFGRFVPDRFSISPGSLIDRAGINTGSTEVCSSAFTYFGENFATTFTLAAQNAAGATTQNYTGGHAKFDLTSWSNYDFSVPGNSVAQGAANVAPSGSWGSTAGTYGLASVVATHMLPRSATPSGPLTGVIVNALPSYTDGGQDIAAASATQVHAGAVEMRFGRLRMSNAIGSEKLNLPIPIQAQYWNGSAFATNTLDSCTRLIPDNFVFGNYQGLNAASVTKSNVNAAVNFNAGIGNLILAKPTPSSTGSVDIAISLGVSSADASCPASLGSATAGANMAYLRHQWCDTGYVRDPKIRARYGAYKGGPVIYTRENY